MFKSFKYIISLSLPQIAQSEVNPKKQLDIKSWHQTHNVYMKFTYKDFKDFNGLTLIQKKWNKWSWIYPLTSGGGRFPE
jgi:hypothetical protein